uniref:Serine-threonine kinase receptor-associated protein n=1 Tax=Echinostoma caproni TaxID=27848 RepID=A0A183AF66_9TREM
LGHQGAVWACNLDAHATKAATGAADFTAKIWDTSSGQELLSITEDHIVRCLDLSKTDSGAHLLTANNLKKIRVYDLAVPTSHIRVCYSADGLCPYIERIKSTQIAHFTSIPISLWDFSDRFRRPVVNASVWSKHTDKPILDMQFLHPKESKALSEVLVAYVYGSSIHLAVFDWRRPDAPISTGDSESGRTFNLPCNLSSVSLHPTEDQLICGGEDHYIYRVDRTTGEILETCKSHFGPVHCVRYAPDGRVFASGSEDGTVRLWQNQVGETYGLWQLSTPNQTEDLLHTSTNQAAATAAVPIPSAQ